MDFADHSSRSRERPGPEKHCREESKSRGYPVSWFPIVIDS